MSDLNNPKNRILRGQEGRNVFDLAKCKNIEVIFDPEEEAKKGKTEEEINAAWLEVRKGFIDEDGVRHYCVGGSDQAIIQGVSPFSNNVELFKIKTGRMKSSMDLNNPNNAFRLEFGHAVEEAVIFGYLCQNPADRVIIDKRTFRRKDKPWLIFDVDGIIVYGDGEVGIFECKTTSHFNREEWKSIPPHYMCQLQHYMGGFGLKRATIACCWGNNLVGDFVSYETKANKEYIERLFADSERFAECCSNDEEPKLEACVNNPDIALRSIQNFFKDLNSKVSVDMPVTDAKLFDDIIEINEKLETATKQAKSLENELKVKIVPVLTQIKDNGAKMGLFEHSGKKISIGYTTKKMSKVDVEKLKDKYPAIAATIIKESASVSDLRNCKNPAAVVDCLKQSESKPSLKVEVWDKV